MGRSGTTPRVPLVGWESEEIFFLKVLPGNMDRVHLNLKVDVAISDPSAYKTEVTSGQDQG